MSAPSYTGKLPSMLFIPDTMVNWPWPRAINPHYVEVKADCVAWFHAFKALNARSQYAFDKGDFALLAALAYPWVSKEHLRTGCDLMHVTFLIDEYTDVEPAATVRKLIDIVLDAMRNPHKARPEGEIILGEISRQFWERAIKTASIPSQEHMLESIAAFLESMIDQASDREKNCYRTVEDYLVRRRENIGVRSVLVPVELGLELPDEVFYHPSVVELASHVVELVIIDNDIASFNKEQAVGDDRYNLLTVVMLDFDVDYNGAIAWLVNYHTEVEAKFMAALKEVPSFGTELDRQLQIYIRGIANFPRCNVAWNFESGRYFGNKGSEYQQTRLVPLLPKVPKYIDNDLHGEDVIIPLVEHLETQGKS